MKQNPGQLGTALIVNELSRFVFASVAEGDWPYTDLGAVPLQKLEGILAGKSYTSCLVDLAVVDSEPEQVVDTLTRIKDASGAPVIVFASGYSSDHPLVEALRLNGFTYFVTSDELAVMYEQLRDCLAGVKNAVDIAEKERIEKEQRQSAKALGYRTVGFAGTAAGSGTTSQAIQYAKYLQALGLRICYIEAGKQGQIEKIPVLYPVKRLDKELGYLEFEGLDVFYKPLQFTPAMRLAYDVCILDFGCLAPENVSAFLNCMGHVCVLGTTPWSYGLLRWALQILKKREAIYLVPFTGKQVQDFWRKKTEIASLLYPVFSFSPFAYIPANKAIYKEINTRLQLDKNQNKSLRRKHK